MRLKFDIMKLKIPFSAIFCFLTLPLLAQRAETGAIQDESQLPRVEKIEVERLPDLNVARSGHHTFFFKDEVVVVGGHTTGFVPTATAECYRNGAWHQMRTIYPHDHGFAIPMKSGKMLIAGGHEQSLGIGQTFTVEYYDPDYGSFTGFGCLSTKRCFSDAIELDNGKVFVSGNWYHDDDIEQFDGKLSFLTVKKVSQNRSLPYILRTSKDNLMIFSTCDNHGQPFDTIIIDRLQGEAFTEPLFDTWKPHYDQTMSHSDDCFIGDEEAGNYAYLLAAFNPDGEVAIIKVEGEKFSMLPTACPVPTRSQWSRIQYFSYIIADREAHRAYFVGFGDDDHRYYVLAIDYEQNPAPLTLYYSDPKEDVPMAKPVLTAEGNLLLAGGVTDSNFSPFSTVWLLRVGRQPVAASSSAAHWLWAIPVLALLLGTFWWWRRKSARAEISDETAENEGIAFSDEHHETLMPHIRRLMEEEKLFLDSELKEKDVADKFGLHRNYVSDCINTQEGCTFSHFINRHRVAYAQQLMREQPDMKISILYLESGFSTESTFFRAFKTHTGMTPKEWMTRNRVRNG